MTATATPDFRSSRTISATWSRGPARCTQHFINSNKVGRRVVVMEWQDGTREVEIRAIKGNGFRPRTEAEALIEFYAETITAPTTHQIEAAVRRAHAALVA